MFATGRVPNTGGLGLEKAGVANNRTAPSPSTNARKTRCRGIYAIGDFTDRLNLTPVAIREGHAFAETCSASPMQIDHAMCPPPSSRSRRSARSG